MSLIRHSAFVARAESDRNTLANVPSEDLVTSIPLGLVVSVNEYLLSFASMDHASLLGLRDLGALCLFRLLVHP